MHPLSIELWTTRSNKHLEAVAPFADAFLNRRAVGLKHPVHDFLFTYYMCSPLKLKQWVPSFGERLLITPDTYESYPWFNTSRFCVNDNVLSYNPQSIRKSTLGMASFIANLCKNVLNQPPRFGCYGLHEWAMVYKLSQEEIRHNGYRLRLSPEKLEAFVKSQTICCTHYDAFRFFTAEARPLNVLNPTIENRLEMEQGGCLHANMDLYKWAIKLWPWIGSDYIAKVFLLAMEGRELDMRASPYDLTKDGYTPLCIETEEGRKQYQKEQQVYAERSVALRKELQTFCNQFLSAYQIADH